MPIPGTELTGCPAGLALPGLRTALGRLGAGLALALCLWPLPLRADCVVLIHGAGRSPASLSIMASTLRGAGFCTVMADYPSRAAPLEALTGQLDAALRGCGPRPPHVVTHSMGAILLRLWLERHPTAEIDRVVMLAPPNRGSALVDAGRGHALFESLLGPAGMQLGTGAADWPARLGPVPVETGVIAGSLSFSPLGSALLAGPDDGKVAVAATGVAGMTDHLVLRATHTFLMNDPEVIAQTVAFLRTGRFRRDLTRSQALAEVTGYFLD
jgi:triacylglycerol lipase